MLARPELHDVGSCPPANPIPTLLYARVRRHNRWCLSATKPNNAIYHTHHSRRAQPSTQAEIDLWHSIPRASGWLRSLAACGTRFLRRSRYPAVHAIRVPRAAGALLSPNTHPYGSCDPWLLTRRANPSARPSAARGTRFPAFRPAIRVPRAAVAHIGAHTCAHDSHHRWLPAERANWAAAPCTARGTRFRAV